MKYKDIYITTLKMTILYRIGQHAAENFELIDASKEDDLWFHVNERPSAHVVAEVPEGMDKKELKYIIKQGVVLCKQESKYVSEKKLPIIYAKIKNIEKTAVVGQVNVLQGTIVVC